MAYTFKEFCVDCNRALKTSNGGAGLGEVQKHFENLLAHPDFIHKVLGKNPAVGRHNVFHDDETNMYVMVHVNEEPGCSVPHDHGKFWVIYGNATGHTDMIEYRRIDDGTEEGRGVLVVEKEFRINSGQSSVFLGGAIHSIDYPANTTFVRLTGGDVENGKNLRFNLENKTVDIQDRRKEARVTSRVDD